MENIRDAIQAAAKKADASKLFEMCEVSVRAESIRKSKAAELAAQVRRHVKKLTEPSLPEGEKKGLKAKIENLKTRLLDLLDGDTVELRRLVKVKIKPKKK